jgi:predicted regulator of Ras-like GTPase activity (Roadblock/LC7/MglB family)
MGGSAKESQLGASAAEVLRDQRHVAEIFKLGNPSRDYLETQKKLLLVSKIVDKKRSLAQVEEENLNLTVEELNIKLRELHCFDLRLFITLMKYLNTP